MAEGLFSFFPWGIVIWMIVRAARAASQANARPNVPPGSALAPAKIDRVPAEFATWESRVRRFDPGPTRPELVLGIDVRGRFPITAPTKFILAASVLDVGPHGPNEEPPLRAVLTPDPTLQEADTLAFHTASSIGVVDPGSGFLQWSPALAILPAQLVPPEEGKRHYRILLVAYDGERPPRFDHGMVEGDVLWAASHDFDWEFFGEGYRTTELERLRTETTIMEFAIATTDPKAEHPATRARLERWIEERLADAEFDEDFDREEMLTSALDKAFARARRGSLDLERRVRALLQADDIQAHRAIALALDLLLERGDPAGRIAGLLEHGEKLGIPRADIQAMIDKRVGGLASNSDELHAVLGIDPSWDEARVRAHLATLYMQWNSRAESLADPVRRAEAEQMLERIAKIRSTLAQEGKS
jgi:hypothetical protein